MAISPSSFQSNLEVGKSSINVIFVIVILIRLRNVGLKSALKLNN